jgi:uncharacterized protein
MDGFPLTTAGHSEFPAINELVVKLASRCNINCTYCYWFNDPLVMKMPKLLQAEAVDSFLDKLTEHIQNYQLQKFAIAFHGGEPTLFPLARFESLCENLHSIEQATQCKINLSMQSNALLIDNAWVEVLKQYSVRLGVSMDGNQQLHDKYRIDHKGRGTYLKTIEAIESIRASGLDIYIMSVIDISTNPKELIAHFVDRLGFKEFDLLLPHVHHENDRLSVAHYVCETFDIYLDELIDQNVSIRILDDLMSLTVGGKSTVQGLGFISTVSMLTNGQLEATDDLRMIDDLSHQAINIMTHSLQQVTQDPLWQEVYYRSLNLASQCNRCELKKICGGGPMVSRWSNDRRFDNPSVYCEDYQTIIRHIQTRLKPHLDALQPKAEAVLC